MKNKILIFRTDRIGDLIVSCPAIITIKKNIENSNITLVASKKNYEYAKSLNIFDNIYKFPDKNFLYKVIFIFKLIKLRFNYIFVFDGKERSIITAGLIRSNYKIALAPKINFFYKAFNIKFFLDDEKTNLNNIFQNFLFYCKINKKISNFSFLKNKIDNNFSKYIKINNFLHIHLDEKWFSSLYIKKYTDINPKYSEFIKFLNILSSTNDIVITTGLVDFPLIDELKSNYFIKINSNVFIKKIGNRSIYLVYKPSFEDLESLLRNSKTLVSCHGSITHAANSFNIKKIDILEKSRINFYKRFTSYLSNYYPIHRSCFKLLKDDIFKKV